MTRSLPFSTSLTQANVIDRSYFARIDIGGAVGTKRFTERSLPGGSASLNIEGTTQTWTEAGLTVGPLDQSDHDISSVSWLKFSNLDGQWTTWGNTPGLRNAPVLVYDAWFNTDGSLAGSFLVYQGKVDNQELGDVAMLALKPFATPWAREVPWATALNLGAAPIMPRPNTVIQWGDFLIREGGYTSPPPSPKRRIARH